MSVDALIRKLEQFEPLSDDEKAMVKSAIGDVVEFGPREDIIRQGEAPEQVHLLLEGWAARYKLLPGGERQIMAYLIPGDMCDVQVALLRRMDHSIATLSRCKIAFIPRAAINEIVRNHRHLAAALWWATLVDEAILREWIVNIGQRPADKRIAHLFYEMLLRMRAVGLTDVDSFEMPLTQEEIGDTMGLSVVHMNRTLRTLREMGLVSMRAGESISYAARNS